MNLLIETKRAIASSGHVSEDIIFIGSEESGHQCSWEEFCQIANVGYDEGFGAAEVAQDLIIVFRDGQKLWRREYDGSEWWEFSKPFVPPTISLPISSLIVPEGRVGWVSLAECNGVVEEEEEEEE